MADLSKLSDDDLERIAKGQERGIAELSDAELEAIASSPEVEDQSAGAKVLELIAKPAGKALQTIGAPFVELDKVTAAPVRAAIGSVQEGGNILDAGGAALDQFKAGLPSAQGTGELLPTTPMMSDVALKGMTSQGIKPEYAATMAPAMGMVADVALDPTMYIPGGAATKGVELAGDAARAVGKGLAAGGRMAEKAATNAIAHTGQFMTGGALKADKALRMYKELNSLEMLVPGSKDWGYRAAQGRKLGDMREALQSAKIEVPGSHDVALNMLAEIQAAQGRTVTNPNSAAIADFIKERAFKRSTQFETIQDPLLGPIQRPVESIEPRDLTLDELDDIVTNMDSLLFTPQGNPKVLKAIYGPAIQKSRRMADEIMQTVPEGELFKTEKRRFEALATAGTQRSKLVEGLSNAASVTAAAYTMLDPVAMLTTRAIVPSSYIKALAVVGMPRDMMRVLSKAQASGSATMVREALQQAAEKYPKATERLVRGTLLMTGKPEGQQTLNEDEMETLALPKSFDPEIIMQERQRIEADENIPSTERAKQISNINKNGYVNMPATELDMMEEPTPEEQVFGGEDGLSALMQSLQAVQ